MIDYESIVFSGSHKSVESLPPPHPSTVRLCEQNRSDEKSQPRTQARVRSHTLGWNDDKSAHEFAHTITRPKPRGNQARGSLGGTPSLLPLLPLLLPLLLVVREKRENRNSVVNCV